ncbi:Rv2231c family pyridoxal phosphate-dependent protein CobC [Modestobacter sp. VKM Ac-2986]|uniref:Rv2231c family pyridoxal phosphate-dependent protein CobC n=1 Tax=Modestobacter sp. VKM Ac-2986 TaxID=3004140 RepID=UPI0022AB8A3B|nr:Rv2231c family pyridoxal phosphate-dependent protein CobC [Modestobacter sp. VKM Ac-2986]MCZ2829974.1 Rv2231c family pyridoxal phosphate-dependent protein CobC [Modestobacter sp. VKM Ac-2986]
MGVGARRGVSAAEVLAAVDSVLPAAPGPVRLATLDTRAADPGMREAAASRGWPLTGHAAETLVTVPVPTPSDRVAAAVGTTSVAEAAALLSGGRLLVAKTVHGPVTVAVAEDGEPADLEPADVDLRHHGDVEATEGLVDLAVNVRAGTPPAWLRTVLHDAVDASAAYPDARPARAAVAAAHGRPEAEVLLTAGAAETFTLLARALTPRRAVVVHPSFTEPEAALRAAGHAVERVLLAPPSYRLGDVPEDADLVVLGNPTNPTSVLHPAGDVAALARPGRVLVVDEAFADTAPGEPESLAGRTDLPGLLVVRSLTKTWGLAGLRVGYALGPADLVAALAAQQPHWPVSTPALAALVACTTPAARAEAEAAAVQLEADRAALLAVLPPGVEVVGTPRASFVLLRVPDAVRVRAQLRDRGWAVRRGDTFPGLSADHLRVAVRDPGTSRAFAAALAAILVPGPQRRDPLSAPPSPDPTDDETS